MQYLHVALVFLFENGLHVSSQCIAQVSDFYMPGDFLIGGLFDIHYAQADNHHLRPEALDCSR